MSLRRQNLSPTAKLLRTSRLFSLPNPLPRPLVAGSFGAGNTKESNTATLPFPTHQAIVTTQSSAARGDWGLKRPLPSRSHILQTSNPVVKIKQWDTIEHITDFDSASDHVRTRQKFEELGIPMLKGLSHFQSTDLTYTPPKSAFEERADVTTYDTDEGLDGAGMFLRALKKSQTARARQEAKQQRFVEFLEKVGEPTDKLRPEKPFVPFTPPSTDVSKLSNPRWKHDGPWLPAMGAAEFTTYLSKEIGRRKSEFNRFLREYVQGQIYVRRRQVSLRNATPSVDAKEAERERQAMEAEWSNISDADIAGAISELRAQCAVDPLTSDLVTKLIIPFLRLPPMKLKSTEFSANSTNKRTVDSYRFSDETTPASTHPSAGLSYLRTKAFLSNHPILGPQALPTPITSRVIQPRQTGTTTEKTARLGVAGFIADDEHSHTSARNPAIMRTESGVQTLDIDTPGGKKILVQPEFASVTADGKILLRVKRSSGPEVAVSRGMLEDRPPERENVDDKPLASLGSQQSGIAELDQAMQEQQSNAQASKFFGMLKEAGVESGTQAKTQTQQQQSRNSPQQSRPRFQIRRV